MTPLLDITCRVLSTSYNSSSVPLQTTYLSFLALFFSSHAPSTFGCSVLDLTPILLHAFGEHYPRVAAKAFCIFSALLNALRQVKIGSDWMDKVYNCQRTDSSAQIQMQKYTLARKLVWAIYRCVQQRS